MEGLEPPTYWFVASHSIQLSYKRMCCNQLYYNITGGGRSQAFFQIFLIKFCKGGEEPFFACKNRLPSQNPAPWEGDRSRDAKKGSARRHSPYDTERFWNSDYRT